jgi:hypothetical protein
MYITQKYSSYLKDVTVKGVFHEYLHVFMIVRVCQMQQLLCIKNNI